MVFDYSLKNFKIVKLQNLEVGMKLKREDEEHCVYEIKNSYLDTGDKIYYFDFYGFRVAKNIMQQFFEINDFGEMVVYS